jgi:hypothetical protein
MLGSNRMKTKNPNLSTRVFLVAGEPQFSNFIEGHEMVVDLYKYMNRSPQHPDL